MRMIVADRGKQIVWVTSRINMAALAAAQLHTDERLSTLIDIVREDRNGESR